MLAAIPPYLILVAIIALPLTLHVLLTYLVAKANGALYAIVFFFVGGAVLFFSAFFFPLLILYFIIAFILIGFGRPRDEEKGYAA
ncbi:MAG: hypothetical protein QXI84_10895 [Thermofilaceae archaeon]